MSGDDATAHVPGVSTSRQGRKAKQRQHRYSSKENGESHQTEIWASILSGFRVGLSATHLQSYTTSSCVPISFRRLPDIIKATWLQMKAVGPCCFQYLATDINFGHFLKGCMFLAEVKLAYAQMTCAIQPNATLHFLTKFTVEELRPWVQLSKRLPYPLAVYLQSIGNVKIDGQNVVPILPLLNPESVSAVVTGSLTHLRTLVTLLHMPHLPTDAFVEVATRLNDLYKFSWDRITDRTDPVNFRQVVRLTDETFQFWSAAPSMLDCTIFKKIIMSVDGVQDLNIALDITSGNGSLVQIVRFPELYNSTQLDMPYYMTSYVPSFEEQLAAILMLGYEHGVPKTSRFMGSYEDCLKRGRFSMEAAMHTLV